MSSEDIHDLLYEIKEFIKKIIPQIVHSELQKIKKELSIEKSREIEEYEIPVLSPEETSRLSLPAIDFFGLSEFLKAVANSDRLKILFALNETSMYFSDIAALTNLGSGPLNHHISKLLNEGLISQERSRGKYFITPRGRRVISLLLKMHELLGGNEK